MDSTGDLTGRRAVRAAEQAVDDVRPEAQAAPLPAQHAQYQVQPVPPSQLVPAVQPSQYAPLSRPIAEPTAAAPAPPMAEQPTVAAPPAPAGTPLFGLAANATEPVPAPVAAPASPAQTRPIEGDLNLYDVLERMLQIGASDLHLAAGSPPLARLDGALGTIDGFGELTGPGIQRALYSILTQKQRERFETDRELDLAYSMAGRARFRVNLYWQREAVGAAFRRIPYEIKTLEQLGMPTSIGAFAALPRGLVLVTGPTGSGKSTTLAALVDLANRTRHDHIMTVEDPIEFLHTHKACLVNQREVGEDTHSFSNALRHALRQDPDIILVGEMRDLETISVALTAAETGHLVFGTLHTQDAAQTIDRVIDVFPPHQQQQVRAQLAGALQGVVSQTLCRAATGRGRVAASEVLVATPAVRNLIREGKSHQVYSVLQAGAQHGMHTLDQNLADLVRARKITIQTALERCHHRDDLMRLSGKG
ncbi:MAG TPA: type IV pilus twitching motility protein PilT [Kineosporiaceae bacterium]|nr:type IV pilus twitching motility protein PilT [Kineosporiaceae bacterium]